MSNTYCSTKITYIILQIVLFNIPNLSNYIRYYKIIVKKNISTGNYTITICNTYIKPNILIYCVKLLTCYCFIQQSFYKVNSVSEIALVRGTEGYRKRWAKFGNFKGVSIFRFKCSSYTYKASIIFIAHAKSASRIKITDNSVSTIFFKLKNDYKGKYYQGNKAIDNNAKQNIEHPFAILLLFQFFYWAYMIFWSKLWAYQAKYI